MAESCQIRATAARAHSLSQSAIVVGCLAAALLAMGAGGASALAINGAHGVGVSTGRGALTTIGDSPDPFSADPLARAVLDRRCPEILADPTWYDDDIIALCLQARKRRHAAVEGER